MFNDQISTASSPDLKGMEGILHVNDFTVIPSADPIKINFADGIEVFPQIAGSLVPADT